MLRFTVLLFFIIAIAGINCHDNKKKSAGNIPAGYDELRKTVTDKSLPLTKRYEAAMEAERIAFAESLPLLQQESLRTRGGILLDMDSLDAALPVYRKLLAITIHKKDSLIHGIAFTNIALIKGERSEYDSAIFYYHQAIPIFILNKDSIKELQSKINLGIAFKNAGKFEDAFRVSLEAVKLLRQMKAGEEKAAVYTTLGNTLKDIRRFDDALQYHRQALDIRRQIADSVGMAGSLNNIGNIYKATAKYDTARSFYLQSLAIKRKKGSARSLATTLDNLSEVAISLLQKTEAAAYATEALRLRDENSDKEGWMTSANRLAELHIAENKYDSALRLALKIEQMSMAPSYQKRRLINLLLLEKIYSKLNQYTNALNNAKLALTLKDSLFSTEMSEAIASLNVRYKTEEQKIQIEQSEKENARKSEQLNRRNLFIVMLIVFLALLGITVYLLVQANRQRAHAQEQTTELMLELNHRTKNNLQIISSMLALQMEHSGNPEVIEALEVAANRIQSVGLLHQQLYNKGYTGFINVVPFLFNLSDNVYTAFSQPQDPSIRISGEDISLSTNDAIYLGLVVNEALTNIYKHASRLKTVLTIRLNISENKGRHILTITDDGSDWEKPTKDSQPKGIGLQLINMLASKINAGIEFYRSDNKNIFEICFEKSGDDHE